MNFTIKATANGSLVPPPPDPQHPEVLKNGDFTIKNDPQPPPPEPPQPFVVGDGSDEITNWTFDFTRDLNFPFFDPSKPVTSAVLTMTLTPKNEDIYTDFVLITGLPFIITPAIRTLKVADGTATIPPLELLDFAGYTSNDILRVLANYSGKIPMEYQDDAIVSSASLTLTQELEFEYAVKFVCGKSDGNVVAPGTYFTAINVHNPTYGTIDFQRKIAIARPNEAGPVSEFVDAKLGPDRALEIGCRDIFPHPGSKDLLNGFVVILSKVELDVVAVYTAAGKDGSVEVMEIERVSPRRPHAAERDN